mgnify:CR=1 FL=1
MPVVDEVAAGLSRVDRRVDGAVTNTAVVRYDAYQDTGGQQSASFAFLDSTRTGTVVTAIQKGEVATATITDRDQRIEVTLSKPITVAKADVPVGGGVVDGTVVVTQQP